MIQSLIEDYTKQGGGMPYAILVHPDFECDELPNDVFICMTERVSGVVIIPLEAAKVFVHGSLFKESGKDA